MRQLSYIINRETNPYYNLALEEYLLDHLQEGECILYLWQNRKTVVIGYNQNAWRECRAEALEADGGFVARRLSGGGAVFHDLGNLNFTFLAHRADYNIERQSEVILRAVQSFGIPAVRNGRNDLTAEGRKFSGNAFYRKGDRCYHHGTILIHADKSQMGKYLTVSKEKLKSKGVESVKSRVVNLEEYVPELTIPRMEEALIRAFGEVYGGEPGAALVSEFERMPETVAASGTGIGPRLFDMRRIDVEDLRKRQERLGSWEWLYGRKIPFQYEISRKFLWGEVQVQLEVSEGIIRRAVVWTDALDADFSLYAEKWLEGVRYRSEDLRGKLTVGMENTGLANAGAKEDASEGVVSEDAGMTAGGASVAGLTEESRAVWQDMLADVIGCITEDEMAEEGGDRRNGTGNETV